MSDGTPRGIRPPVIGYTADGTPIVNPPRPPRYGMTTGSSRAVRRSNPLPSPVINKRRKRP